MEPPTVASHNTANLNADDAVDDDGDEAGNDSDNLVIDEEAEADAAQHRVDSAARAKRKREDDKLDSLRAAQEVKQRELLKLFDGQCKCGSGKNYGRCCGREAAKLDAKFYEDLSQWTCSQCTFLNAASAECCEMCSLTWRDG